MVPVTSINGLVTPQNRSPLALGFMQTTQNEQICTGVLIQIASYPCLILDRLTFPNERSIAFANLVVILKDKGTASCELRPKTFFRTINNFSICAVDWQSFGRLGIHPFAVPHGAFTPQIGDEVQIVGYCHGIPQQFQEVRCIAQKDTTTLTYDLELPLGCNGAAVFWKDQLIGIHSQPSYGTPSNQATLLHPILSAIEVRHKEDPYLEMHRLIHAITEGDVGTLQYELEHQGPIYLQSFYADDGRDLLYFASYYGQTSCLTCLLTGYGAKDHTNRTYKRSTRLGHIAASRGHLPILEVLYNQQQAAASYDMSARDVTGNNLAHLAAMHGHVEILRWIYQVLPEGRQMIQAENGMHFTPAHIAASCGKVEILQVLDRECGLPLVGDKALNSKGMEPIDAVEDSDQYLCRAYLWDLCQNRGIHKDKAYDRRLVPHFGKAFEAAYRSGTRPLTREEEEEFLLKQLQRQQDALEKNGGLGERRQVSESMIVY